MKNNYKIFSPVLLVFLLITSQNLFSQVLVSDGSEDVSANSPAVFEVRSNTKGMLIPRITTAQRTTLTNTAVAGLLVFDSDLGGFFIYGNTSAKTLGWVDLSSGAGIWKKSGNNIFLTNSNYNVGIGTNTPSRKFVIKAENDNDTLFEILDKDNKPLMIITPKLSKFYFNEAAKGVAGGFAVGRYATAKANISDTALFIVTQDSTRVYTSSNAKGVAGGFAVGRYATAKGNPIKYFHTSIDSTRVYTNGSGKKGVAGGFAVGRYATAKGENAKKYFYADIDSTRIYTDGSETKGVAGGFAVGRYATAKSKSTENNYMYMVPKNYFLGHLAGNRIQTGSGDGQYNTFFGYKAGFNNFGSIFGTDTVGSRNVFVGYEAGLQNSNGGDNICLGYNSGRETHYGSNNLFLGSNTGLNIRRSTDNVFLGSNAGRGYKISDAVSEYNVIIGKNAGRDIYGTKYNVFIGHEAAMGYVTTDSITGNQNVIIGKSAGLRLTSGDDNVFVGAFTGRYNKAGEGNVFVGQGAGTNSGTGNYNTYLGHHSGHSSGFNTTSDPNYNTAVGYYSGFKNETGEYNTFLGHKAGYCEGGGSGDNNVFLGNSTGYSNLSGYDNVFIGHSSGYDNETGYDNVFIGFEAGKYNDSGFGNVVLGYQAGQSNQVGEKNVFIGYKAGRAEFGSNKLYIANSQTLPLVYGEFDNGYLKVNGNLEVTENININQNAFCITLTAGEIITAGDVLVISTSADLLVIPSSSASDKTVIGIATENAESGNPVTIAIGGAVQVMINNTVTRGDFLETSTTSGEAQSSGTTGLPGDFAIALEGGTAGNKVWVVLKK